MFFDEYPLFHASSHTASSANRLNLRYQAMIASNRDILSGARVLDLASHDGRWSFAALEAGAAHVTGVEARPELVESAGNNFSAYGVAPDRYEFVRGDMFGVMTRRRFDVDVVLCFGFVYHTLRYLDLFRGIADARPLYCVIDTKVILGDDPTVQLFVNHTGVQSNAARDRLSNRRKVVAGWPSLPALKLLLDVYDFDVEEQYDWAALLASQPEELRFARDYNRGNRVTLRCRNRAYVGAAADAASRAAG